jgi:hypothetical protein
MPSRSLVVTLLCVLLAATSPATAQEGHPLKGSWLGTWTGNTSHGADLVMVLDWDGKAITGTINPGVDNMTIRNATLTPEGWLVHLEAEAKDKSGRAVTYIIDGAIENLHVPTRSVTGKWKSQRESGTFKITRQ